MVDDMTDTSNKMSDSEFMKGITTNKTASSLITFLAFSSKEFQPYQRDIWDIMYSVASIGNDGEVSNGLERLKKKFPSNFDGSQKYGTKTRGNFKDEKKQLALYVKYIEIAKLIVEGKKTGKKLQTEACKSHGIDSSQYRKFRDPLYKIWKSGETKLEFNPDIDADEHLAINVSKVIELNHSIFSKTSPKPQ